MKLKQLQIHNIASIKDAEIDFEAKPLSDSDLVLITGETGSGKSTILDAICLALFANTPRMENTNMGGSMAAEYDDVKLDDPRQLMRRNTGEAFVKLAFAGNDGNDYVAEWSVARSYGKIDGTLQAKKWNLTNLTQGKTLSKDKEIREAINSAIQLDFNQFCRTSMLAQGEFTRFLNSNDNEKAEILEKITGADIYSKIGKRVFEMTKVKKTEYEDAERRIDGVQLLSVEQIEEKTKQVRELENRYGQHEKEKATAEKKRQWLDEDAKLLQAVEQAKLDLQKACQQRDSEENKSIQQLCENWHFTESVRADMQAWAREADTEKQSERTLTEMSAHFKNLRNGILYQQNVVKDLQKQVEKLSVFIESQSDRKKIYENEQTIKGHLTTIIDMRKKMAAHLDSCKQSRNKIDEQLKPMQQKADAELQQHISNLENLEKQLKELDEKLEKMNLPALHQQQQLLIQQAADVNAAETAVNAWNVEKERVNKEKEALTALHDEIARKQEESKTLTSDLEKVQIQRDTCKGLMEKQQLSVDKWAKNIRQHLHTGDICPVCQHQLEQELPSEGEFDAQYNAAYNDFKAYDAQYQDLQKQVNQLNAQIENGLQNHQQRTDQLLQSDRVGTYEQIANDNCLKCELNAADNQILNQLAECKRHLEKQQETLKVQVADAEKLDVEVKTQRQKVAKMRPAIETEKAALENIQKNIAAEEQKVNTHSAQAQDCQKQELAAEKSVSEIEGIAILKDTWKQNPEQLSSQLVADAAAYRQAVQDCQTKQIDLDKMRNELKAVENVISKLETVQPEWTSIVADNPMKISDSLSVANDLLAKVAGVKQTLCDAQAGVKESKSKVETFMSDNPSFTMDILKALYNLSSSDIQQKEQQLQQLKVAVSNANTVQIEREQRRNDHLTVKPEIVEGETVETLSMQVQQLAATMKQVLENKNFIENELTQNEANKQKVEKLIAESNAKRELFNRWDRLNDLIGDADGKKFRKIAQSYVLSSLVNAANLYLQSMTRRYTMRVEPGTYVIFLEDAYQNYACRSASTISGGESFLVSLALALALSDIGERISMDTLFIDEGFGTLSGEPLQNAVNTLRSLRREMGRRVAIISHIEELKNSIPTQIQVERTSNNSCSTIKVV